MKPTVLLFPKKSINVQFSSKSEYPFPLQINPLFQPTKHAFAFTWASPIESVSCYEREKVKDIFTLKNWKIGIQSKYGIKLYTNALKFKRT